MPWEQLIAARDRNRDIADEERNRPPTHCPYDGARLQVRDDGVRACPLGNYTWR